MDFISNELEELKAEISANKDKDAISSKLFDIIEKLANRQDFLVNKIDELEGINESLISEIRDMQQIIIKNFDLEDYESDDDGCDCGHCSGDCQCGDGDDEARKDEFYTLQCPFCEELFFIEKDELDLTIECPFCNKEIKAVDNLVKH